MDFKNINLSQLKTSLAKVGTKLLAYRFYFVSAAVLILLSVVILDVSVVTDIEADADKIDTEQNATARQLDQAIIEQIEERLGQSSQSASDIPAQNPFEIN